MTIEVFEPKLLEHVEGNRFFSHFLTALVEHAGARPTDDPRPSPQLMVPRHHQSCWIRCDGRLVFFDMSDHVHLLDLDALRLADVYFKANLNRGVAARVLADAGMEDYAPRLHPFLFISAYLDWFARLRKIGRWVAPLMGKCDVAHVVGVYENPLGDGGEVPGGCSDDISPAAYHVRARYHTQRALRAAGLSGVYRLTSRGNQAIEDGRVVLPNLSRRSFAMAFLRCRAVVVNTLPHALFPFKVSESLALGRPLILDVEPVTEIPEGFRLQRGVHYLTLFDGEQTLRPDVPLDHPLAYRTMPALTPLDFDAGAARVAAVLSDHRRMAEMSRACLDFVDQVYSKQNVARYIIETVGGAGREA